MHRLIGIFIWLITALGSGAVFVYLLTFTSASTFVLALLTAGIPSLAVLVLGGLLYLTIMPDREFR
jgi:hypothetical protein